MKTIVLILALSASVVSFTAENSSSKARAFSGKIDVTQAIHRIQLGSYSNFVPVKIVELLREIGGVKPISQKGTSTYFTAAFNSEEEAAKKLPKYRLLGFDQAKHVVEYKKSFYDLREFNYLAEGGKVEEKSEIPVIRIWK